MLVCSKRKSPPFVSWVPTLKSRWLSARGPLWCSPNRSVPDATTCGSSGIEIAKDCCNTANGNAAIAALSIERRSIFSILNPLPDQETFSIAIVRLRRIRMLLHPQLFHARRSQSLRVLTAIGHAVHPFLRPGFEVTLRLGFRVILLEKRIVSPIVALYWRRMRAQRALHHCRYQKARDDRAVRIAGNHVFARNFFCADNH